MLQIKVCTRNGNNDTYEWFELHVGDSAPQCYTRDVVEVQADGDELREVQILTDSLPRLLTPAKHYSTQRWFGDHAKWIAANIVGCK